MRRRQGENGVLPTTSPAAKNGGSATTPGRRVVVKKKRRVSKSTSKGGCSLSDVLCYAATLGMIVLLFLYLRMEPEKKTKLKHRVKETRDHIREKIRVLGNTRKYYEVEGVAKILDEAPAAVNDEYVVLLAVSSGERDGLEIAVGKSAENAHSALKQAQSKLSRKSNTYPHVKVDIVTGVKRFHDHDYLNSKFKISEVGHPGQYGLALDWDNGWIFGPSEVLTRTLVDADGYMRWERILAYAWRERQLHDGIPPLPENVDDEPVVEVVDTFHTLSVFIDMSADPEPTSKKVLHTHDTYTEVTPTSLLEAAKNGADYLARSVKEGGRLVYEYFPRSDEEPNEYNLTRHAGVVYAMAVLYQLHPDPFLLESMTLALDYLKGQSRSCPMAYDSSKKATCVWERDTKTPKKLIKLGANALTVLAMAEYMHATGKMDPELFKMATDMVTWIGGCQHDDGSFLQKALMDDDGELELFEDFYVRYYQGEVTFALARLYAVTKADGRNSPSEDWIQIAHKAASYIVKTDSQETDEDLEVDHWLLYGIAEMAPFKLDSAFVDHAMRTARVVKTFQAEDVADKEHDFDLLAQVGIYYDTFSATSIATITEGLCAVHDMAVDQGKTEEAKLIRESIQLSARHQLQAQYTPTLAMFLPDPLRIMGGFSDGITTTNMRNDFTQHNICALACVRKVLLKKE